MLDAAPPPPPSHYEQIAEKLDLSYQNAAKTSAFAAMASLEGWCSTNKASILMDLIFILKPKTIVEIGVWGGKSLIPMAFALKANNQGKIYGVDPWDAQASIQGMEGQNKNWWGKIDHAQIYNGLAKQIERLELTPQIELIKATSKAASPISPIDLLHIDGNHSDEASYLDVQKWVPLVAEGGLIVFDDINWKTTKRAVDYLNTNCTKLFEYQGANTWGVWVKRKN